MDHTYESCTRDGIWHRGSAVEERLSSGAARRRGDSIAANDAFDAPLDAACSAAFAPLAQLARSVTDGRVRAVASVRRVRSAGGEEEWTTAAMTVTIGKWSVISTPDHFAEDVSWLRGVGPAILPAHRDLRDLPLLWTRGSASVLLHEAIGHAAEEGAPPIAWPQWLRVRDEPPFRVDDAGNETRASDLLVESPASYRRSTFRDVPIRRMTHVVVEHRDAPAIAFQKYIDVQLAGMGRYDAVTDEISLTIAHAEVVDGSRREALAPFEIRQSRDAVRRSLAGASGSPQRYPGVVCSTDGQKLVVTCEAPVIATTESR